jgi:hypothetical protein
LVDLKNKTYYKWASDEAIRLESHKRNVIALLYAGIEYNPITLELKRPFYKEYNNYFVQLFNL